MNRVGLQGLVPVRWSCFAKRWILLSRNAVELFSNLALEGASTGHKAPNELASFPTVGIGRSGGAVAEQLNELKSRTARAREWTDKWLAESIWYIS